jgi:alpha-glucosidase
VRAGAIVPRGPVVQHTRERSLDEVTLLIYPEGSSRFEMYEDDGRSRAYLDGRYALTAFECVTTPGEITVRIAAPTGDTSVVPPDRRYVLQVRAGPTASVRVDGAEIPRIAGDGMPGPGWWDDGHGFTWVRLPDQRPPADQRAITVVIRTAS